MRVSCSISLLFSVLTHATAAAAPTQFPYEALVKSDDVVVRSGPGERYDPTLKLSTGQHVTVHRHDPGGWFMVSPPAGSFSWIDAAYVEKTGPEAGVVKVPATGDGLPPRVVVWIGSQFTDEHKYFGRQLANGDEVRILGEKQHQTDRGAATFFKIAPPRLEYRWVKGDFIVPLSEAGQIARTAPNVAPTQIPAAMPTPISNTPQGSNPFARLPSSSTEALPAPGFPREQGPTLLERELTRGVDSGAVSQSPAESAATAEQRTQLFALDDQLKAMLAQTPETWNLVGMEQAYRQLQAASGASVAAQIDSRLVAIESRKKIKAEYDAFVGVITQTEQRDAALLSMRQSLAAGVPLDSLQVDLGQPTSFPQPGLAQQPGAGQQPIPAAGMQPPTGQAAIPAITQPSMPTPPSGPQGDIPQLDGAGVVQRLQRPTPGLPTHALVSPDGRLLAYLSAGQGVQLDPYVGQSMGVIGQRSHNARLRSDIIVVEKLLPVQLQP
jgi:uncharacterized protein YraI